MPDLTLDEAPEASSFHDRTIVFFWHLLGPRAGPSIQAAQEVEARSGFAFWLQLEPWHRGLLERP